MKKRKRTTQIVVHISDRDPRTGEVFQNMEQIKDFHVNVNGWSDVGYHYGIDPDGNIEAGRAEHLQGAHVKGHNAETIAVVVMATDGRFSMRQISQLKAVCKQLCSRYFLSITRIRGHRDFPGVKKSCPQFDSADLQAIVRS